MRGMRGAATNVSTGSYGDISISTINCAVPTLLSRVQHPNHCTVHDSLTVRLIRSARRYPSLVCTVRYASMNLVKKPSWNGDSPNTYPFNFSRYQCRYHASANDYLKWVLV